jgi:adenine C2-methylase RlmN of 23S rRNA A2503 and tRNA A37
MTKKQEIITQVQSLVQLVSGKDFLTDFQKKNYNILIKSYQEPAENFANDYDT